MTDTDPEWYARYRREVEAEHVRRQIDNEIRETMRHFIRLGKALGPQK